MMGWSTRGAGYQAFSVCAAGDAMTCPTRMPPPDEAHVNQLNRGSAAPPFTPPRSPLAAPVIDSGSSSHASAPAAGGRG